MVANVTSLTGNGLRDWLIQRVSAVVLAAYTLVLLGFCLLQPELNYAAWQGLFQQLWFKVFSALALLNLILHAWIGIWTVCTDYIKCTAIRLTIESLVVLALIAFFIWGIAILWGVA